MAHHITDKILALAGATGSLVASIFLSPPKYVWGVSGLVIAATSLGLFLQNRWVQSSPNEWLLVIRNGQLIKAGVGLKTFAGLTDTVVKFASRVQKIQFTANNVTKEMQGVVINGFAFWSVYRDDDGPFRCYKYMEGGDANSNVRAMCQSALRNLIANSSLDDVLKNRNHLRDNMLKDLKDQFKGWGIWLQTVEITEVTISSKRLFEDLQAQFRQDARLKADKIQLITKEQMTQSRQESQMKTTKCQQENNTKRQQTRNNQQLKRQNQTANFQQKKNQLQLAKLQRDKQFAIQKLKTQLQEDQERLNNQNKIKTIQQEFELDFMRKKLQLDRLHDEKTLQKYQIDTMQRIYQKLGVKEIKINQFIGDGKSNLASILPSMGFAMGQMKTAE